MKQHPDDTAALDAAPWADGTCGNCRRDQPVTSTVSGDPACRGCLAYALYLDRGCGEPLRLLAITAEAAQ